LWRKHFMPVGAAVRSGGTRTPGPNGTRAVPPIRRARMIVTFPIPGDRQTRAEQAGSWADLSGGDEGVEASDRSRPISYTVS
jgi:hypothetical protein